jgi:serine/threonine-protein kinase
MKRASRLEEVFGLALELPGEDRASFVADVCVGDPELEARLLRLLDAHDRDVGPLDEPLATLLASLPAADGTARARRSGVPGEDPPDAASDGLAPGTRVGSYEVVREIARGGMGTVYLAERADGAFEQQVALKVIHRAPGDLGSRERFLAERHILARLRHPNIARILDGGVTDGGRPYFAMEYVVGTPITTYCDDSSLDVDARLDLILQVCEAVAHAHGQHVVHRDLKPSNILVAEDDRGIPRAVLLDFGIAKLLDPLPGAQALTRPGLPLLTPEYAVPEQLRGDPITPATDVYALGLVLYELLAGRRAYELTDGSTLELTRVVCDEEPAPPSATSVTAPKRLRRRLRGDLDAICLTALEKEPTRRYASAEALADDIRRHRDGLPIHARRPTAGYRALRFAARHRAGAAIALVAVATSATAGILIATGGGPLAFRGADDGSAIRSANARRLLDEGLRTLPHDPSAAQRFFRASLAEDSTLALAAYHTLQVEGRLEIPRDMALESRLRRLVPDLPEREQLLMQARMAEADSDPSLASLARRLITRYPEDPEGHFLHGRALLAQGDLGRSRAALHRAIEADSQGLRGDAPRCVGCDAYASLVSVYVASDSLPAAERVVREWISRRPAGSLAGWFLLAAVLEYQARPEEALAAMRRTSPRQQTTPYLPIYPALLSIREGEFDAADALLREQARAGPPDVQREALWFLTISLRYQGRLREALATSRLLRGIDDGDNGLIAEAQVLFEMGHAAEAANRFDSLAAPRGERDRVTAPPAEAHSRSFALTRVAVARHAAGDTVGLVALADSIQAFGAQTLSEQRRRLHHHVRGLLLASRGDLAAAEDGFRRAIAWSNHDYTRTSLKLARVLIELGRPAEAVPILERAFRGPLETARLYVTHTELHELLGRALEAAGEPERAATHYEWVLRAWQSPDPVFEARRGEVRRRFAALEGRQARSR